VDITIVDKHFFERIKNMEIKKKETQNLVALMVNVYQTGIDILEGPELFTKPAKENALATAYDLYKAALRWFKKEVSNEITYNKKITKAIKRLIQANLALISINSGRKFDVNYCFDLLGSFYNGDISESEFNDQWNKLSQDTLQAIQHAQTILESEVKIEKVKEVLKDVDINSNNFLIERFGQLIDELSDIEATPIVRLKEVYIEIGKILSILSNNCYNLAVMY